jgi:hypothetical protein
VDEDDIARALPSAASAMASVGVTPHRR